MVECGEARVRRGEEMRDAAKCTLILCGLVRWRGKQEAVVWEGMDGGGEILRYEERGATITSVGRPVMETREEEESEEDRDIRGRMKEIEAEGQSRKP
ncbi:hypothetical protein Pcinc_008388 [Petrolisthes cinctipes]|uniref:Uncharacterized protein n=1 Tax=Petrolisthes cinctipes TaxID=88211 RepID=A0AAE1G926_PETCI|nr:hypothetical protein Pcinc_008388 [Petrolisthes cinctipes]